jgi:hydrogenase-4 component E
MFAKLSVLTASAVLIFGLVPLWRRRSAAHIGALCGQSVTLALTTALTGYFGGDWQLYLVACLLLVVKGVAIPLLLTRMDRRFGAERELDPYVNTGTSLVIGGVLVLLAYVVTRPLMALTELPTRAGLPLCMGLIFVSLFVIISRKKALTQVIGFLMLENGIALLAVLGTFGIPFIVEVGVFLDALMGFLVMQIFVYQIHETFESIDVDQLKQLQK